MHSRIYQISDQIIKNDKYITESDFNDHYFTREIADYVDEVTDRVEEIQCFRGIYEKNKVFSFNAEQSFKVIEGGKEMYFAEQYLAFRNALSKLTDVSSEDYHHNHEKMKSLIDELNQNYCEEFGSYVAINKSVIIPMDEFIRKAKTDTPYYIGAILDYHW